ncbi:hypothetical protein [Asanoa sp. NPDC050611]|uniref:hypothetical protein n=1 Tax=Asanoa sp. NPDC050611 TaxID=3157098 RepID=UPI0033DB17A3
MRLIGHPDAAVRAALAAGHRAEPREAFARLLDDPVTRAGVVRHVRLTAERAERLAGDPDQDVRVEVAGHPRLPAHLRDRLGADPSARVRVAVFARPDTPEPLRRQIAGSPSLPPAEMERILTRAGL